MIEKLPTSERTRDDPGESLLESNLGVVHSCRCRRLNSDNGRGTTVCVETLLLS